MHKLDLVHFVGEQTCMAASHVTSFLTAEPACTEAETWNMGFLALTALAIVLTIRVISAWRKNFRDTYR